MMLSKQTLMTISPCWFLLRGCRCVWVFFACRWLPGWVHHAVEHRCARCGGLCQPQVCLQSASQLELYIGITVYIWPCISQPLSWGFILESLCPSNHVFTLFGRYLLHLSVFCSQTQSGSASSWAGKSCQQIGLYCWRFQQWSYI